MVCHEGQEKPFGNKYTNLPGQLLDMWHMKGRRTGPAGGEYTNVPLVNGKPQFMGRDAKVTNAGGTFYIKCGAEVALDDMGKRYGFGFAAFDNAQVRHATTDDPMYLVFGKK